MNADPTGRLFLTTLLIGGLIGAVVGFTSSIIIQGITYGFSNINWGVVALDTFFGAVSGLINVSPIGIIGQMTIGVIMSTAQYIGTQLIRGEEIPSWG